MAAKKKKAKPGPEAEHLKIEGDWKEAVRKAIEKPRWMAEARTAQHHQDQDADPAKGIAFGAEPTERQLARSSRS